MPVTTTFQHTKYDAQEAEHLPRFNLPRMYKKIPSPPPSLAATKGLTGGATVPSA
jgi:hypothetical protein